MTAARLAVETGVFPLYEVVDGVAGRLTADPPRRPVREYLSLQGRFAKLDDAAVAHLQAEVDDDCALLARRCAVASPARPPG